MFPALIFVLFLFLSSPAPGATPQDDLKKIQDRITEEKKKLSEVQERESTVIDDLDDVNKRMSRIEVELNRTRSVMKKTEGEIEQVTLSIHDTKNSLKRQKEWVKRKLRVMHRSGASEDFVVLLMGSKDVTQTLRIWKYLERIAAYEQRVLTRYRDNIRLLDEKYRRLAALKAEQKENEALARKQEAELADQRKGKEVLLASIRSEKKAHQKMLSELRDASQRLLNLIRESSKKDDYQGTGFGRLKGRLPWPSDGVIAIPYGAQKDPQFDTPVFRNGVHLQTEQNTEARSVYGGKVIFAEWFKGFGQLVIVNHGSGYHTLYGNLSEIFSRVGDIIKDNQVLGKVGQSGVLNAPGLYFEIRYKGKPLDPMQWLRKHKG